MKREYRLRLANALESGKYKKTKGRLRRPNPDDPSLINDEFCCLGVACDIFGPEIGGYWDTTRVLYTVNGFSSPRCGSLPLELANHIGSDSDGSYTGKSKGSPSLLRTNDRNPTWDEVIRDLRDDSLWDD